MIALEVMGHAASQPAFAPSQVPRVAAAVPSANPYAFSFPVTAGPVINRFTIDDVVPAWSKRDDVRHPGRRLGGFANYRTDRYER